MKQEEVKQIILLNSSGLPITWRSYCEVEMPSKEDQFLMTGFLSAITSFATVLTKGGQLNTFVIDDRVFYIRGNASIIAVFEGNPDFIELIWSKIQERYIDLQETFEQLDALLQKEEIYRQDLGVIIDTIVTSIKADLENLETIEDLKVVRGTGLLSRLRRAKVKV